MQESKVANNDLRQHNHQLQHMIDNSRVEIQELREEMRALHDKHIQEVTTVDVSPQVYGNVMYSTDLHACTYTVLALFVAFCDC